MDAASRALAAARGHATLSRGDICDGAALALAHRARQRLRRDQDETSSPDHGDEQEGSKPSESEPGDPQASEGESSAEASADASASASDSGEQTAGSDQGMTTGGSSGHEAAPDPLATFNLQRID